MASRRQCPAPSTARRGITHFASRATRQSLRVKRRPFPTPFVTPIASAFLEREGITHADVAHNRESSVASGQSHPPAARGQSHAFRSQVRHHRGCHEERDAPALLASLGRLRKRPRHPCLAIFRASMPLSRSRNILVAVRRRRVPATLIRRERLPHLEPRRRLHFTVPAGTRLAPHQCCRRRPFWVRPRTFLNVSGDPIPAAGSATLAADSWRQRPCCRRAASSFRSPRTAAFGYDVAPARLRPGTASCRRYRAGVLPARQDVLADATQHRDSALTSLALGPRPTPPDSSAPRRPRVGPASGRRFRVQLEFIGEASQLSGNLRSAVRVTFDDAANEGRERIDGRRPA